MKNLRTISNMNMHYFVYPYCYYLEHQKKLDFDTSVVWGSVPHIWADQFGVEDIDFNSINPGARLFAARPYNYSLFFSRESVIGAHSLAYYRHLIDFCEKNRFEILGIDLWGALRDEDATKQLKFCVDNLKSLCLYAKDRGIHIMIGCVPFGNSALINSLPELRSLFEQVNEDVLTVSMEYGLAYLNGETVEDWLSAFDSRLSTVYLSDVRANGYGYPLGKGVAPIEKVLTSLDNHGFSGIVALKMDRKRIKGFDPVEIDRINSAYLKENEWI